MFTFQSRKNVNMKLNNFFMDQNLIVFQNCHIKVTQEPCFGYMGQPNWWYVYYYYNT